MEFGSGIFRYTDAVVLHAAALMWSFGIVLDKVLVEQRRYCNNHRQREVWIDRFYANSTGKAQPSQILLTLYLVSSLPD